MKALVLSLFLLLIGCKKDNIKDAAILTGLFAVSLATGTDLMGGSGSFSDDDDRLSCINEPHKRKNTISKDSWYYIDWYNTCKETCKKYPEPMKRGLFPNTNWNEEKAKKWKEICDKYKDVK